MNENLKLWLDTLDVLKTEIAESDFSELFVCLDKIHKVENGYIYISVPQTLNKIRIEKFYNIRLNEIATLLSNETRKFKFITEEEAKKEIESAQSNPFTTPTQNVTRILSPIYTFKNFEIGESNRFAFLAAMKVAETPEKLYNPLYIFGDVGLGKTHLMTAIGNYILDNNIETNIVYVSSQKFAEEYFLATNSKKSAYSIENFYEKYQNADVLLIDDIQFMENRPSTQEEFFKIFEHLVNQNKQIVITSDKPANELKNTMDRLKSRFNWGLSVDIKVPDKNLRINILKSKLSGLIKDPNDVPFEVLECLAEYFVKNIRDLEGALRSFITYCVCMNVPFTKENMFLALERTLPKDLDTIQPQDYGDIVRKTNDAISQYYNISPKDLVSTTRKQQIAYPRHIAMYILRTKFNLNLKTIGEFYGNRDHASVAHGVGKIESMLKDNNLAKNDIDFLLKNIEKK